MYVFIDLGLSLLLLTAVVVFGSFFLLNLTITVLKSSYMRQKQQQTIEREAAEQKLQQGKKEAGSGQTQHPLDHQYPVTNDMQISRSIAVRQAQVCRQV